MRSLALVALFASACGSDVLDGPFPELPLEVRITVVPPLDGPVSVARDRYGLAHIYASTTADAMFVQGYLMAHDRLPQMDVLRRMAQGTLAELYGEVDPRVIETDLRMRMHRLLAHAEQAHAELEASLAPRDAALLVALDRFSAGVNAYVTDLQLGRWQLDPDLAFDPQRVPTWTPADSLSIARFHTLAMSWTAPLELELTDLYQRLRTAFAATPRVGVIGDLLAFAPIGLAAPLGGFPAAGPDAAAVAGTPPRPTVPQAVLDRARATLAPGPADGVFGAPGPHALLPPFVASNAWAFGGGLPDADGLLAVDHVTAPTNPSLFYPIHVTVMPPITAAEQPTDVVGLALAGMPGTIVGTNGAIAWANTVGGHDLNDLYLEACDATTCAGPDGPRAITPITELIAIGHRGEIRATMTVVYEHVEGHGPIVPEIRDGALVPRAPGPALAVRYAGHAPTLEARAFTGLAGVRSLDEALALVEDGVHGGPWTFMDRTGAVAWTTAAPIPRREPAAYAWHVRDVPDGAAPFFVLDGRGGHDWTAGAVDARHLPRLEPGAARAVITGDGDPVGASYDGDPLDQRDPAGDVLYAGVAYDAGLREARAAMLLGATAPLTSDVARAQHDTTSTLAMRVAPVIVQALGAVDGGAAPADVAPYLATLTEAERTALRTARALLAGWTFTAPPLVAGSGADARATALFHTWMHFFTRAVLADELAQAGYPLARFTEDRLARIVDAVLVRPGAAAPHPQTGEALLCDAIASAEPESCTRQVLAAMVAALAQLAGVGDAARVWGHVHRLAFAPLFDDPSLAFRVPATAELGFPRGGDSSSIARAAHGWDDLDFAQTSASAHRFLAIARGSVLGARIDVQLALPSGTVLDRRDTHYRDLVDTTYLPDTPFDVPIAIDEITAHGESRWELR